MRSARSSVIRSSTGSGRRLSRSCFAAKGSSPRSTTRADRKEHLRADDACNSKITMKTRKSSPASCRNGDDINSCPSRTSATDGRVCKTCAWLRQLLSDSIRRRTRLQDGRMATTLLSEMLERPGAKAVIFSQWLQHARIARQTAAQGERLGPRDVSRRRAERTSAKSSSIDSATIRSAGCFCRPMRVASA